MNKYQLIGEFECKLDAKGRLRLPSALIRQIGHTGVLEFTINRGFEKHLMMYPRDVWTEKAKLFSSLNIYNTKERKAMRYFYRGATMMHVDSADRILISGSLIEYAGLEKDVILFAYDEQIEIWDKKTYVAMLNEEDESFDEVANEIFGSSSVKVDRPETEA